VFSRNALYKSTFYLLTYLHKIKQWRSFLSEAQNKTVLTEYITDEWKESETVKVMIKDKTLFVTCGEKCWKINRGRASLVKELQSSQEEADM